MSDPEGTSGPGEIGRARLDVSIAAPVEMARAADVLGPSRAAWTGEPVLGDVPVPAGMARHLIDLQMRVAEHSPLVTFRKAAYLDVGEATTEAGAVRLEISWRAAGLAPLFPVFSGHLTWRRGRLAIRGVYAPPGGSVGVIADRLLFNIAARGTARWLLQRIVAVMEDLPPDGSPQTAQP